VGWKPTDGGFDSGDRKRSRNSCIDQKLNTGIPVVNTVIGRNGGTYVCKELVYAYAMWIRHRETLLT
jgi:hypothetical protein